MKNFREVEKNDEMFSLNEQLYDDFFVQELETRLETDPLMVGGLVEFTDTNSLSCFTCCFLGGLSCTEIR